MPVELRHLVLYVVEQVGERPNGKTYIQKMCFFVEKLIGQPLGFRAHYYGPYSDRVSAELAFLTASGFLYENRRGSGVAGSLGWEIARFDYRLTDRGKEAVEKLKTKRPDEAELVTRAVEKVLQAGQLDYVDLSFAGKGNRHDSFQTVQIPGHQIMPVKMPGIDASRPRMGCFAPAASRYVRRSK